MILPNERDDPLMVPVMQLHVPVIRSVIRQLLQQLWNPLRIELLLEFALDVVQCILSRGEEEVASFPFNLFDRRRRHVCIHLQRQDPDSHCEFNTSYCVKILNHQSAMCQDP
jgi:hypothetical protein